MKRTILSIIIVILAISSAHAGNEVTLTYSQIGTGRLLRLQLDSTCTSYCLQIRQDADTGRFKVEAPTFLAVNVEDTLRLGEIQDSGLFSLMLDPMVADPDLLGFRSNFRRLASPSLKPALSGIALSLTCLDLVALSPVLNPESPYGLGALYANDSLKAGLMLATQNEAMLSSVKQGYQMDWRQLGLGRHMVFSILGSGAKAVLAPELSLSGSVFMQNAWDLLLGGGTTVGWNLELDLLDMEVQAGRRLGGSGVKLKRLERSERPMDSIGFSMSAKDRAMDGLSLDLEYRRETYETPVYGGESQRRVLDYSLGVRWRDCSVKARSSTSYDIDRGKVSKTVYSLSAKLLGSQLSLQIPVFRPIDGPCHVADLKFSMSLPNAELELMGGRTRLRFNWECISDGIVLKLWFDQDRTVGASLKLNGV